MDTRISLKVALILCAVGELNVELDLVMNITPIRNKRCFIMVCNELKTSARYMLMA